MRVASIEAKFFDRIFQFMVLYQSVKNKLSLRKIQTKIGRLKIIILNLPINGLNETSMLLRLASQINFFFTSAK